LVLSISSLIKKSNKMKETVGMMVIVGILSASILITALVRFILSKPINDLVKGIARISGGDLKYKVPLRSNDEIGTLALSFNKMAEDLSKTLVSKDYVDNIISSMADSLIVADAEGKVKTVNSAALDLLGYKEKEIIGQSIGMLIREEKEEGQAKVGTTVAKRKILMDLLKNGVVNNFEMNYLTKDEKKIPVIFSGSVVKDKKGKIVNIVCVAKDITELKQAKEKIKASLREKEVLLREIHHRVKNNLQVISSLLILQSKQISGKKNQELFQESQNRVKSMALIHEKLYQSQDLASINFKEYLNTLIIGLFRSYQSHSSHVELKLNVEDITLGIDSAIPCGLIINELVSNSLKYAFPNGREGVISVVLRYLNKKDVELVVSDNGIGMPEDLDFRNSKSLGLHLVTILAEDQLGGEIKLSRDNGTEFRIKLRGVK